MKLILTNLIFNISLDDDAAEIQTKLYDLLLRDTREEEVKIRERINVLGIPMQEFFLDSFTSTEIVILWGMFANERLAIEIKRLSTVLEDVLSLEDDNFDADEVLDDVRCCRICLEEIESILSYIKVGINCCFGFIIR